MRARRHAFRQRLAQHALQMVEVAVHVAVGEQADEVQRGGVLLAVGDQRLPHLAAEQRAAGDRRIHQLGPLREHAPAADGVMPHFAVAHILIAGQPYRRAVRLQLAVQRMLLQPVQARRQCASAPRRPPHISRCQPRP